MVYEMRISGWSSDVCSSDLLNRLGALDVLESYLVYLRNIVDGARGGHIQPLYDVRGNATLEEREAQNLPGYRGMGPVRVGNAAYSQVQHDAYGQDRKSVG